MTILSSSAARRAKRAQFQVVKKDGNLEGNDKDNYRAVMPESVQFAECDTDFVKLYRDTLGHLSRAILAVDVGSRVQFFHAMRFMQLLGLRSQEVVEELEFSQENVCRWMSGQRCPHPEMRKYVLQKCLSILDRKAQMTIPPEFTPPD